MLYHLVIPFFLLNFPVRSYDFFTSFSSPSSFLILLFVLLPFSSRSFSFSFRSFFSLFFFFFSIFLFVVVAVIVAVVVVVVVAVVNGRIEDLPRSNLR